MSAKFTLSIGIAVAAILATVQNGLAQLPSSELHTVYPHAAAAGQTVEVSLTGLNLDELSGLHFSDPRVKAERVMLPQTEFQKAPVQNGTKFKVTVPADVPPGMLEARSVGLFGLSTSRPFEIVAANTPVVADAGATHHKLETAPALAIEATGYGRTDASQVDYWKFTAKKDQRLLIHCWSERLDAKTDATLVVVDASGKQLERNRDYAGRDPMIDFTAPADGDYFVGIHDFLYNGGADYPYSLVVSAKPHIDFVFPPAGQAGQVAEMTLFGRNLPGGSPGEGHQLDGKPLDTVKAKITVPAQPSPSRFDPRRPSHGMLPAFDYRHQNSNAVRIGFAKSPVIQEQSDAEVQTVTIPCEIAGRFDESVDTDRYRFTAKKDTVYWVEAVGDRLSGKIDPYIVVEKITKPDEAAETYTKVKDLDDTAGKGGATFDDASRDAAFSFTADQDGDYRVSILNQFGAGGIDHFYRLGIREAKPDFHLLAVAERPYHDARQAFPAAPLVRQGGTAPLKIIVQREDGFEGPVILAAEGLPAGVTSPPVNLGAKDEIGYVIFKAAPDAAAWSGTIKVTGKAKVGGADVAREARLGAVTRGVTNDTTERLRARLEKQIPLAVSAEEKAPVLIELGGDGKPLVVEMDQKLDIPIKLTNKNNLKGNLAVTAVGLRGLVKSPAINIADSKADGVLAITFKNQNNVFNKPEPGIYTFVLQGKGTQTKYRHNPKAADRAAEEQKLAGELAKTYTAAATKAKTDAAAAKAAFDAATKAVVTATAAVKTATGKATAADVAIKAATAKAATTDAAAKAAAAKATAAATALTAANAKFAAAAPAAKAAAQKEVAAATAAKTAADAAAAAAAAAKAAADKEVATATAAKTAAGTAVTTATAAKTAADKALADAKTKNDAAVATAAEAEKKRLAADAVVKAAPAKVKAATDKAKEKDIKFAAYSLPITVEVKPKPEPEKK